MEVWRQWAARRGIGEASGEGNEITHTMAGGHPLGLDLTNEQGQEERQTGLQPHSLANLNSSESFLHIMEPDPFRPVVPTPLMMFESEPCGGRRSRVRRARCDARISGGCSECGGIPIDPIPITFGKSPPCKANLLTPQSNLHKSLHLDMASESGDWCLGGGG